MFRPNSSTFFYPGAPRVPTLTVVQGDLVTEVYQTFSEWATHVVRLLLSVVCTGVCCTLHAV